MTVNGTKRLVIQNVLGGDGRFAYQLFGVWDIKRHVMVYHLDPNRQRAEAYLHQLEMDL